MIYAGIDPGLTGAISFLDARGSVIAVDDIPTMAIAEAGPKTTIKREIDVCELRSVIFGRIPDGETCLFVMEHTSSVGAMLGDQAKTSLAATKASIMAVLRLSGYEVHRVHPVTWKRFYGLHSDKDECLNLARNLFFDHPSLKRKKDHNRAESLLIARWGLRHFDLPVLARVADPLEV
jgi:hypothetical protein